MSNEEGWWAMVTGLISGGVAGGAGIERYLNWRRRRRNEEIENTAELRQQRYDRIAALEARIVVLEQANEMWRQRYFEIEEKYHSLLISTTTSAAYAARSAADAADNAARQAALNPPPSIPPHPDSI